MAKKMLIDATHPEETRVVVVDGTQVEEFDFETVNKRQLAGNIYLAKVTRVEPSLQAAFVEYGGNRHGFLAFAEIHPDYYQIPAADRKALLEEERAAALAAEAEEDAREKKAEARARRPQAEGRRRDPSTASDAVPGMEMAEDHGDEGDTHSDASDIAPARADAHDAPEDPDAITASDRDETIEDVGETALAAEVPAARKQPTPRARRYKIQEVVKVRQIMLVQVVKEERGNKGAALTTYLSLAGRYCVLMPNTARGGGISRKITNAADRKKLKDIAGELEVPQGAGLIIRTAGSQRTRTEIRRDYEYLMRLWEQIRELTFRSTAPAPIYEEGDLIKRTIRDLYAKDIDEVLVEGERGYRTARDFMAMIMPDQAKAVKHYRDPMPLLARYQAEGFLSGMFNPVVQLKSGGYIVIGITEALVAIDVNSGRATKEGSIEETAYKTNCEAADEIARQLRLRDLAGLIVIDFIDMDERRNNAAVEKRFKDKLKTDRARIQVGRISGFGLMEMSRQRLRPGMLESTTQPCAHCHGTGLIRSNDSLALQILRAIDEEGTRKRSAEVLVKAPVAVANYLMNAKREHIAMIEARSGMSVRVEADPTLISPDYAIEKFKTATRVVEVGSRALSVDATLMAAIDGEHTDEPRVLAVEADAEVEVEAAVEAPAEARGEARAEAREDEDGEARSSRRRRRRRRRGGNRNGDEAQGAGTGDDLGDDADGDAADIEALAAEDGVTVAETPVEAEAAEAPARTRKPRSRSKAAVAETEVASETAEPIVAEAPVVAEAGEPDVSETAEPVETADAVADAAPEGGVAETEAAASEAEPEAEAEPSAEAEPEADPVPAASAEAEAVPAPEAPARPKRRGWWSFGA